jgi:hypothetical protein
MKYCDQYYPCSFFYSSFSSDFRFAYATSLFLYIVFGWFFSSLAWLSFDELMQRFHLYEQDNIVFARVVFNGWDWIKGARQESARD